MFEFSVSKSLNSAKKKSVLLLTDVNKNLYVCIVFVCVTHQDKNLFQSAFGTCTIHGQLRKSFWYN